MVAVAVVDCMMGDFVIVDYTVGIAHGGVTVPSWDRSRPVDDHTPGSSLDKTRELIWNYGWLPCSHRC